MSFIYLLEWWYGNGWIDQWQRGGKRLSRIARAFSGGTLLKTLFAPWKRMVATPSKTGGLDGHVQAFLDNLVSRFVGFNIRILTLLAATTSLLVVGILTVLLAIVWLLLPFLTIVALIKAMGLL